MQYYVLLHSVCCRSPIVPVRLTFSAEMLNSAGNNEDSNIWTNPMANGTTLEHISKNKVSNDNFLAF